MNDLGFAPGSSALALARSRCPGADGSVILNPFIVFDSGTSLRRRAMAAVRGGKMRFHAVSMPVAFLVAALAASAFAADGGPKKQDPAGPAKAAHAWYRPPVEFDSIEYIIVTARSLVKSFKPLAAWKTRCGVPADVVAIEDILDNPLYRGTDPAETIRNFITDLYWKWGLNYALLGGDANVVPTRMIPYDRGEEQASDLYFSALDGTWNADCDSEYGGDLDRVDHVEDVYVGRVPVETPEEAAVFMKKFFTYTKPIHRDFQKKVLLVGAVLRNDFQWDADDHYVEIRDDFLKPEKFTIIELEESATLRGSIEGVEVEEDVEELVDGKRVKVRKKVKKESAYIFGESNGRAGPSDMENLAKYVNEGVGIMSHIIHSNVYLMGLGHGFLDAKEVKRFTNIERPFVVFSSGCQVNMFNLESISERVLLHPEGGCAAFIGCTVNSYAYQNMFERDFWEALLLHGVYRIGPLLAACKARRNQKAVSRSDPITIIIRGVNLLGDPDMPIWTAAPLDLSVSHPASAGLKASRIEVHAADKNDMKAVRGAQVCLWKEGEFLSSALTGPDGKASVECSPKTPGAVLVTVTARNYMPYEAEMKVSAGGDGAGKALALYDSAVSDSEKGNGNGRLEGGEEAGLFLAFQNTSGSECQGAKIKVKDAGKHLKVIAGETTLKLVKAGGFAITEKPIVLAAGSETPQNQRAVLKMSVEASGTTWDEEAVVLVNSPWVVHVGHRFDDSGSNNDGDLNESDAGKKVDFIVDACNLGTGSARNLTVELKIRGDDIKIENSSQLVPEVPVGARMPIPPFKIALGGGFAGSVMEATLTFTDASGLSRTDEFALEEFPEVPHGLDGSGGVDSVNLWWETSEDEKIAGYNVYRADGKDGAFMLISPTPVPASCFEDNGLSKLSFYRYRVSAVDRSLNESKRCKEFGVWTSYALQRDWPQVARGPIRQVAVFDVDGNGDPEIAASAGMGPWLWHCTGQEFLHGGDYWTFGLFRNLNHPSSAPVFADVDGDGKLELLCCLLGDTKKAYAMSLDGKDKAGWPKDLPAASNWQPQAADLDGDGRPDIVVYCDGDGSICAFRGDGKPLGSADKLATLPKAGRFPPVIVNMDGDNDLELVGVDGNGDLYSLHHNGSAAGIKKQLNSGENLATSVAAGDVDGDGKPEFFAVGDKGGKLHGYKADGTVLKGFPAAISPEGGPGAYVPAMGDLDGDSKPEISVATPKGGLFAFKADGTALKGFPAAFQGRPTGIAIADLDGDASPDLLVAAAEGKLFAFRSNGLAFTGWPIEIGARTECAPAIADLDRDGDLEILLGAENWRLYIRDMPGPYNPGTVEWPGLIGGNGCLTTWQPAPKPPSGVKAAFDGKLKIEWQAPAGKVAGYHVYRSSMGGLPARITALPLKAPSFVDETATGGSLYGYSVTAILESGRESLLSPESRWENPEPARLLEKGRDAETRGEAAEAAKCFSEIRDKYRQSSLFDEAMKGLGRVRDKAAIEDPAEASARDSYCAAHLAMGESWAERGMRAKALESFARVQDRDPYGVWGGRAAERKGKIGG